MKVEKVYRRKLRLLFLLLYGDGNCCISIYKIVERERKLGHSISHGGSIAGLFEMSEPMCGYGEFISSLITATHKLISLTQKIRPLR